MQSTHSLVVPLGHGDTLPGTRLAQLVEIPVEHGFIGGQQSEQAAPMGRLFAAEGYPVVHKVPVAKPLEQASATQLLQVLRYPRLALAHDHGQF